MALPGQGRGCGGGSPQASQGLPVPRLCRPQGGDKPTPQPTVSRAPSATPQDLSLLASALPWGPRPFHRAEEEASSQRLGPPLVCRGRAFWLPVPLPSPHPARKGFSSGDGVGQSHPTPHALWGAQMGEGGHTCPDAPSWVGRGVGWDWTGAPGWCWGWGAWRGRSKEGQPALPLAPASVPGPGHPPRPRPLAAPLPPPDPAWPCPHPP